jgi:hypothetical protein
MKCIGTLVLLNIVMVFACFSQRAKGTLVASVSGLDRMSLVKSSIDVPAWHEKSFWPIYENYLAKAEDISSFTYRSLDDLAKVDRAVSDEDALNHANKMLAHRHDLLTVRKEYFGEIGGAFNGVIALQFLQTEILLDMMESSRIYEETPWKNFRFQSSAISPDQLSASRQNMVRRALALTAEEDKNFWKVFNQYEEELDALLGEDYSVFGLYAGEPSDYTPALAKRLGRDLLQILERELTLKEKYFAEMNRLVGPSLAARFLAWDDYNSLVSKMYAWVEK